jgi:hypothetical protein
MLIFLARNELVSNPCHWHDFPPSPVHYGAADIQYRRKIWLLAQTGFAFG